MTPLTGQQVGQELCRMFSIDPNTVTEITVNATPDEFATVTVTTLPDREHFMPTTIVYDVYQRPTVETKIAP